MLKLSDVHVYYGHVHALRGLNMTVEDGKIVSLLGGNGAGKSTTLKMISRLIQPKKGSYEMDGQSMLKDSPSRVVKKGIIHCPENRRVFPLLTVEENLKIGAYSRKDKNVKEDLEKVFLYFPRLKERVKQKAGTLSGGEQQMLAIGRSLMGKPKILLLDEPSLGIAPILVKEIFEIIKKINKDGTSILLVEQNANMALGISDYAYVLENGHIALEGHSQDLRNNDEVRRLYLGG
ncbi:MULTISPECIES: ABC transporter ATP-binding protein [Neobacillus]|uniref:ABC transporter ATP-binding protein n=1 Tax=Neobacillus rhizophilus TaxID=2833579 RepID=A0A942YSQ0_9BACI|nr:MULTISPECIES: ABC transporter ATP-binding protein [Neobacillus]MBS4211379.1 ABC transporter ATP-binding protein [Neobacillus rhizophilus]MBU8916797.1 ABC transporter ATP-binding protein [Bacillus sp. FJAT-29953]